MTPGCPAAPGFWRFPPGGWSAAAGLRGPDPDGPDPEFAVYVVASELFGVPWEYRWIAWPDFGLPADQAVEYVRRHYHPDAVETAEQRQFVARFS